MDACTYHICVVIKAVSEIEELDKVPTELARIAPGHARTHMTNLEKQGGRKGRRNRDRGGRWTRSTDK